MQKTKNLNITSNSKLITINSEETMEQTEKQVLKILLKDMENAKIVTTLAEAIGMSRVGMWKLLKKLEKEKLIILEKIGRGETSTYTASLNWSNPLTERHLSLILAEEAAKQERWLTNFKPLENKTDSLIIYGSILHSVKEANDIDILNMVSKKENFKEIEQAIMMIQKTQLKKIHSLSFTHEELKNELEKPNTALRDAVQKGIILFGQENFIRFMKEVRR